MTLRQLLDRILAESTRETLRNLEYQHPELRDLRLLVDAAIEARKA
jgi:hypothetical protein